MSLLLSLHHEDDLLEVIDRALTAPDRELVLAIPEGARILASEENFALLKRELEAAGKRFAIQTSDGRAKFLAAQAGIPLTHGGVLGGARRSFSDILPPRSVPASSAIGGASSSFEEILPIPEPHEVPRAASASSKEDGEEGALTEDQPTLEKKTEEAEKSKRKRARTPRLPSIALPAFFARGSSWRRPEFVIVGAALLIAFFVANEVLASITLRIHPRSEAISFTLPIKVSVDGEEGAVVGQKIRSEETAEKSTDASGSAVVSDKARGTVTISNSYRDKNGNPSSQTLVATTRFVSQEGKLFRLDETVVVPAAKVQGSNVTPSSLDAKVTADEVGPDYNIGPASFSIPGLQGTEKFTSITARSSTSMQGGARGQVKVVTAEDIEHAKTGITDGLSEKLQKKFQEQTPKDLVLLEDASAETIVVDTDVQAGAHADRVLARAQGQRSAVVFADGDLKKIVEKALAERMPSGTDIIPESLVVRPSVKDRDLEKGRLVLSVAVEARAAWHIDVNEVREALAGKKEAEIRGWVADQKAVESAQVRFTPFWITAAPDNRNHIKVEIDLETPTP